MVPFKRYVLERKPPLVWLRVSIYQEALEEGVEPRQQQREIGNAMGKQLWLC
jgi:hypothetical protein